MLIAALVCGIVLPTGLYLMLSSSWAQQQLRLFAQKELSALLGVEVSIDGAALRLPDRLTLSGVAARDDNDSIALRVAEIDARVETIDLLRSRRLIVDYANLSGLDLRLYRDSLSAPLNIQGIISRLSSKPKSDKQQNLDLTLNGLSIADSHVSYTVLSAPVTPDRFNPQRIDLSGINATIYAPRISSGTYMMELAALSAEDVSGLTLTDLSFALSLSPNSVRLDDFCLRMPRSALKLNTVEASLDGSIESISKLFTQVPVDVAIASGTQVYLPDLRALVPDLAKVESTISLRADASVTTDSVSLRSFTADADDGALVVMASGNVSHLSYPKQLCTDGLSFQVDADATALRTLLANLRLPSAAADIIRRAGRVSVNGTAEGSLAHAELDATLTTAAGKAIISGIARQSAQNIYAVSADLDLDFPRAGALLGNADLGAAIATVSASGTIGRGSISGDAHAQVERVEFKGYAYTDVDIEVSSRDGITDIAVASDADDAMFALQAQISQQTKGETTFTADADITAFTPYALGLTNKLQDHTISGRLRSSGHMRSAKEIDAELSIEGLSCLTPGGDGVSLREFTVTASTGRERGGVTVKSDFLNGEINGDFQPLTLVPVMRSIVHQCFPIVPDYEGELYGNDFAFDFTLTPLDGLSQMLGLPVQVIHPVYITGEVSRADSRAEVAIDAPWLMQGSKIVENTAVSASLRGSTGKADAYATTLMPTKKGPMTLVAHLAGTPGKVVSDIDWQIERAIPINGNINFSTSLWLDDESQLAARMIFNPGKVTFGDAVWDIVPSSISYAQQAIDVDHFILRAPDQSISINGRASALDTDVLAVGLNGISLIDIFETLEIDKALIGGRATGDVYASGVLSKHPVIQSPKIHVDGISYNYCTLGDADIVMQYDNDLQAFWLDADVVEPGGLHSRIFGNIIPATEQLDITFDAQHVKVGFLKPFMKAFASDVRGYASGRARLFGTFKYIDLEGDILADSVGIKIDFTNTWYTATDSLHIRPGEIALRNLTIRDVDGHTAKLNGVLKHTFFNAPVFEFNITDAENFLCYDVTPKISPDWYGTVYGNGSAYVHGQPGVVDIGVNMTTTAGSTFTFVLSDTEVADELSFIEFRDATPVDIAQVEIMESAIPQQVLEYHRQMQQANEEEPTAFNLDIQADITPQAQVVIVMDPVGGDRIRAYGSGNLRMTYGSRDNDLRMYGKYTLERGSYNFTLQDIIIKDFTIKDGSSITFRGDPYSAQLDLQAIYSVNANLSDLDESFLTDKDLTRTNVPVHALMKVTGDMRQPAIAFDLEFPTLTSDIYRKVRSIVSTDEMMNRQIIYLLALNRFYTPDYMAGATRGNELFSVASSTISSQLSSILGKLSDNWSIAPNLRSDRGDFSDLEVDLTLSSTLLNNRLLFNGNLGYRDKSLNTSQFIGDFDIEYLLNRRGSWRLKAYNRYNDQNYYLRTAQTTQGVGIIYRRDFDRLFNFLRRKPKDEDKKQTEATDSVQTDASKPAEQTASNTSVE